jgi:hypothetical protein
MSNEILVDRLELLAFYDDPHDAERGVHATAINAVAGEELGLALVIHYFRSLGIDASIIPGPCTTGGRQGYRLDGWIRTSETVYQVEVKNWSSHSIGGKKLPVDAGSEESSRHRIKVWNEYWSGDSFREESAAKVLEPMLPPFACERIAALIAFWDPMHPEGLSEPLFQVPLAGCAFTDVTVFSMSSYLRGLQCTSLALPLPKTIARLDILARIFET